MRLQSQLTTYGHERNICGPNGRGSIYPRLDSIVAAPEAWKWATSVHIGYSSVMDPIIKGAIPVLPAADTTESLNWWTHVCGFKETFRDATPPNYAGINRGEAYLHIAGMSDKDLARKVGDQTMVRIAVQGIQAMYAEYQKSGGKVHPHGALQTKPWGTKEFAAIDPNGVCVTFQE
jgi:predicted enzyme related to lactoylglutathione lyase